MLADKALTPSAPQIYPIYRGFYVLPNDTIAYGVVRLDVFCQRSPDGHVWTGTGPPVGYGTNDTGWYVVHTGLDENYWYQYLVQFVYSDGSKTPLSQPTEAGPAQLVISSDLNIDQLASKAYTTGLMTSGIFRGVIFQTSALDPRVQMDPSGLSATDGTGNLIFKIPSDGVTDAYFKGQIDSLGYNVFREATPTGSMWTPLNFYDGQDSTSKIIGQFRLQEATGTVFFQTGHIRNYFPYLLPEEVITDFMELSCTATPTNGEAVIYINADGGAMQDTYLQLESGPYNADPLDAFGYIKFGAGNYEGQLIDGPTQQSSFIQTGAQFNWSATTPGYPVKRVLNGGTASGGLVFPANSTIAAQTSFFHGLGTVPKSVQTTITNLPGSMGTITVSPFDFTNDSFTISGICQIAPTSIKQLTFCWLAFG